MSLEDRPADAVRSAWFRYRAIARKQEREADERSYMDGWRDGARFTFGATSKLSPALDAFIRWAEFATQWEPEPPVGEDDGSIQQPAAGSEAPDVRPG